MSLAGLLDRTRAEVIATRCLLAESVLGGVTHCSGNGLVDVSQDMFTSFCCNFLRGHDVSTSTDPSSTTGFDSGELVAGKEEKNGVEYGIVKIAKLYARAIFSTISPS